MNPRILILSALIFWRISNFPVYTQITTPCSPTVISSMTPCLNFLTNSSGNGASPTADCCGSLRSLTGSGLDCLCLLLTAGVPFRIPINRTLAISLPRACNMPGVPVRCRASAAPLPAPGPVSLGPTSSPVASPASVVPEPAEAPESDTTPQLLTPPPPRADTGGSRSSLTPSVASPSSSTVSLPLLLLAFGFMLLKCH